MPWNPEHYSMKKQNPIAKEVRTPKYRQRIVKDKTVYNRKKDDEWWERHKSYIDHRKEFPYYPEKNKK